MINGINPAYRQLLMDTLGASTLSDLVAVLEKTHFEEIIGLPPSEGILTALFAGEIKVSNNPQGRRKLEFLAEELINYEVHQIFSKDILIDAPDQLPAVARCDLCKKLGPTTIMSRSGNNKGYRHKVCQSKWSAAYRKRVPYKRGIGFLKDVETTTLDEIAKGAHVRRRKVLSWIREAGGKLSHKADAPFSVRRTGNVVINAQGIQILTKYIKEKKDERIGVDYIRA